MVILLGGVIAVLILVIVFCIVQIVIMNFPWGLNEVKDVTTGPLPLYHAKSSEIRQLAKLGFQGLGVLGVRLFWRRKLLSDIWYYLDGPATTCAAVTRYETGTASVMIVFSSWFPDHALIETYYPTGENFDDTDHIAHFVKSDLERGYSWHQTAIQKWAGTHGTPLVIHDVKQLIPLDAVDMKLHRRRRYRRLTRTLVLIIAICSISIFILGYVAGVSIDWATWTLAQTLNQLLFPAVLLTLCLAALLLVLYPVINPPGALDR